MTYSEQNTQKYHDDIAKSIDGIVGIMNRLAEQKERKEREEAHKLHHANCAKMLEIDAERESRRIARLNAS